MKKLNSSFFKSLILATLMAIPVFASNEPALPSVVQSLEQPAPEQDSSKTNPVENAVNPVNEEIALRDSLMAVHDSINAVEKDSLRKEIEMERAKTANWEKSYNTIKKDNEVCAQALNVSIGVNEKKVDKEKKDREQMAMMTSSTFLGGVGIGMLLFWLIFE